MITELYISEIFKSIQGESTHAGLPFVFIRLAGCNLNCRWCDTPASRSHQNAVCLAVESIMNRAVSLECPNVCVTGGEPLQQEAVYALLRLLQDRFEKVTLETNGSIPVTTVPAGVHKIVDVKCPSSGMSHHNCYANLENLNENDEVKFIIADRRDYDFAREISLKYLNRTPAERLVSPAEPVMDPHSLAKWVLSDKLLFRLQLQLHKLIKLK